LLPDLCEFIPHPFFFCVKPHSISLVSTILTIITILLSLRGHAPKLYRHTPSKIFTVYYLSFYKTGVDSVGVAEEWPALFSSGGEA